MALPAIESNKIAAMPQNELFTYFCDNARHIEDAPAKGPHYAIRFGSRSYFNEDTAELWWAFKHAVELHRRRTGIKVHAK